jgi:hypothetical protein
MKSGEKKGQYYEAVRSQGAELAVATVKLEYKKRAMILGKARSLTFLLI